MMEEIGLLEAMHSQMSITRYKPDPVPREAIDRVVEAATKAPSGGNTQPWHFPGNHRPRPDRSRRRDLSRGVAGAPRS